MEIKSLPKRGNHQKKKIRNAMGVGSVRKKSSRWEGSSSSSSSNQGVMDEEIRNAMEVEIRRLKEEEEFDKNITNAMWEEEVLEKMRNAMRVERVRAISRFELTGVTDDEEIRNAMEVEIRRLKEEDEIRTNKYLMEIKVENIRNTRSKFVLHISPLEIIDNPGDQDFINVVVAAENINQIELVIIVIDHHSIHQYWTPRSATSSSSSSCQHHDDGLHPRDDDDEEMILAACRPLLDTPKRIKIILDQGVFAAYDDNNDDDEQHIMSPLLRSVDVLFKYSIIPTYEHLEDLKRSITRSISEAKPHVLRVKPKRVRICVQVSRVQKQYYGSAEDAIFDAAVHDACEASVCHVMDADAFYEASACAY